jgi:hypothetical protein
MPLPDFDEKGELPAGLHLASLNELAARFGGTPRRQEVTARLLHIYELARATGKLDRFIVFGSYVTSKPAPNDVDIFLVMAKEFEVGDYSGETRMLFSQMQAQDYFGASIFWVASGTSFATLEFLIAGWQTKRDKTRRGIVEVVS